MTKVDAVKFRSMLAEALPKGVVRLGAGTWEWNCAGPCTNPVCVSVESVKTRDEWVRGERADARQLVVSDRWWETYSERKGDSFFGVLGVWVPCRKCERCRDVRRRRWGGAAVAEINRSERTWHLTLTLASEWQTWFGAKAALDPCCFNEAIEKLEPGEKREIIAEINRAGGNYVPFEALPFGEQMLLRHKYISKEITLMIKRWRKTGVRFRYMLVLEAHKSGLPHYHMLLHECGGSFTKRYLESRESWRFGFVGAKLVDKTEGSKAAWYVAKYLSKNSVARVRASFKYGNGSP